MRALEWLVLLPLWRRVISDPKWHVPAAIGTGVAWVVIIIIIAVASGGGDDDSDTTVQDQGTPEPATTATAEAEPTEEAAAPTPTSPPDEADTDDLAALAYLDELSTLVVDMGLLLNNIVALSTEAANDPSVLFGERWFEDLGREQDRLNAAQSTFLALQPPAQLADTHRLMTQALNEMDIALDLFETGGRDFDDAKISEAAGASQWSREPLDVRRPSTTGQPAARRETLRARAGPKSQWSINVTCFAIPLVFYPDILRKTANVRLIPLALLPATADGWLGIAAMRRLKASPAACMLNCSCRRRSDAGGTF